MVEILEFLQLPFTWRRRSFEDLSHSWEDIFTLLTIFFYISGVHLDGLLSCHSGMSVLYEDLRYDMIMSVYENENEMGFCSDFSLHVATRFLCGFCAGKEGRMDGRNA